MQSNRATVISVDGHAAAPLEDYRDYVEQRYHDAFDETVGQQVTVNFDLVMDPVLRVPYREMVYDSGMIDSLWNPDLRIKMLDEFGIAAEVLFPDGAPFGAGGLGGQRVQFAPEHEQAGARAYNRWLADFCSAYPERFGGQAIVSFCDVEEAIKEVYWAKEHGLRGLFLPGMKAGQLNYADQRFEPFWSAAEETGLPINFHGGTGLPDYGWDDATPMAVRIRLQGHEFGFFAHRPLWFLIWSGALERHPGLKVVFTEQHSDWVVGAMSQMDHSYEFSKFDDSIKELVPLKPSEYWNRQCFMGASLLATSELEIRDEIGMRNLMFGADFPHPESTTWPDSLKYLQATIGRAGMGEEEVKAFLSRNAAEVFNFDLDVLDSIAAISGFGLDEVRTPLPDGELEIFSRTDVVRPAITVH